MARARVHACGHALFDAEQLTLHQRIRQRRAVQGHKRLARPRAGEMHRLGRHLLARTAFAGDEHVDHAVANPFDEAHHLLDFRPRAHDAVGRVAALHLAPQVGVLPRQFVLAATQLAHQLGRLDGIGGVSRQRLQHLLVARSEASQAFVERFKHADDGALVVAQRHGHHAARAVAGAVVDAGVKPPVLVGVPDVDRVAGGHRLPGHTQARIEAENLLAAQRHLGPQLVALAVQQKDAGAVAIEQPGGFARDQVQQGAQLALRIHLLADGQNGGQPLVKLRLGKRTHWRLSGNTV